MIYILQVSVNIFLNDDILTIRGGRGIHGTIHDGDDQKILRDGMDPNIHMGIHPLKGNLLQ